MKKKVYKRWPIILLNVLVIGMVFYFLIGQNLGSKEPPDLPSFAITVFAGYLFFFLMPVEVAFVYFAKTGEMNLYLLVSITITLAMLSLSIDYLIGHYASPHTLQKIVNPEKFEKAKKFLKKYGIIIIFLFNFFPLSSPLLLLAAGMLNYPFKTAFFISLLGLSLKYSLISLFST